MRLKDVLALPKDVNSLPLLKSYLNQSLDYHDHMAAFLHYIDILYYVKSFEILIQESEQTLQRYLKNDYDEMLDHLMSLMIDAFIELEKYQHVHKYIQLRLERLPVLKKHEVYIQMIAYKTAVNQQPDIWLQSVIDEDMPKDTYKVLAETLLGSYIKQKDFENALKLHQDMVSKLTTPYIIEFCQIYDGLQKYQEMIQTLKPLMDTNALPEYVYYLIKAYIKSQQLQRAINLEVEYETLFEQAEELVQVKYYKMMLALYEDMGNNISINVYKAHLNKIQSKQRKQQKQSIIEPTSHNQQKRPVQVTLETHSKTPSIVDVEKMHDWLSYQLEKTNVQSYRDSLRLDFIKFNQLVPFQTMIMYQKYNHEMYYFKKERLYDKKVRQQDLDQSYLKTLLQQPRDGFIEPHIYENFIDIISQKPFVDVKQLYTYQSDDIVMIYYFNQEATTYAEFDDLLRLISTQMMMSHRDYLNQYQLEAASDLFNKLMTHPHLVARVYKEGVCTYSKAARRWFQLEDDEPIEPFIKNLPVQERDLYKAHFKALYNYEEPSKVLEYTYQHRRIKEFAVVHKLGDHPLILSVFYDESSHVKQIETVKHEAKKDNVSGLLNLHAFLDDLPELLKDKLTILKIQVNKNISFLYGQTSYLSYFKEFGFLTKKLIEQSQVYMYDGQHFIVTVPYNDIRTVNLMIKKYFDGLSQWISKSIPQEPFTPKVGIIRYPVVTTEKNAETLMHYLDIALSRIHDEPSFYYFKYQDFEHDQFEQHLLDQMLHAIEHQQFSIGFQQIIDQQANRVWMYESFAYIPHLDVEAKDIMFIAKKRKRLLDYDMEHIKQVLMMLSKMYEAAQKYIKILIPIHVESFTHHLFVRDVAQLMKTYDIPPKIIDFNIIGDMKASVYLQLVEDVKAIGIGIHTSSLKVSLYYNVDALHFDIKHPDDKMLDYLKTIHAFSFRQHITFVLRGVSSKDIKQTLAKAELNIIEGSIYKRLTKDALFSKVVSK